MIILRIKAECLHRYRRLRLTDLPERGIIALSRKTQDEHQDRPSVVFAAYAAAERERWRDTAEGLDEKRFQAALDLALERLQALESPGEGRS